MDGYDDRGGRNRDELRCSFCGKSKEHVQKFISGPSVYICNECIKLCNEILQEEALQDQAAPLQELPTPQRIKDHLDDYVIGQDGAKKPDESQPSAPSKALPEETEPDAEPSVAAKLEAECAEAMSNASLVGKWQLVRDGMSPRWSNQSSSHGRFARTTTVRRRSSQRL